LLNACASPVLLNLRQTASSGYDLQKHLTVGIDLKSRRCFAMILSTHAVVGGAIASLVPSDPILAAAAGFASHFAIDAIPHWDYPLRSISVGKGADNRRLKALK
jgi:hypothetical protein